MYPRSFSKSLNYKLRELELIIQQLNDKNVSSRIDVELALDKTRELYNILLKINSGYQEEEENKDQATPSQKSVVASDPDPVEDNEISEAEGITTSPMYRKPEKEGAGAENKKELPEKMQEKKPDKGMKEIENRKDEKTGSDPGKDSLKDKSKKDEQPSEKQNESQSQDLVIVADRYQSSQNYINQAIANKQTKKDLTTRLQSKPIKDLRNSIGMNEKFLFIKELFKGRPENYNQCIDDLNQSATYEEAINYIKNNYSWEENDEVVEKFINLLKRKHQSG